MPNKSSARSRKSKRNISNRSNKRSSQKKSRRTRKKHSHDTKSVHFHKMNCSPSGEMDSNDFTCYSTKALNKLRDKWNLRHPDNIIPEEKTPREVWSLLKDYMSGVCHTESCWLRQDFMSEDSTGKSILNYAFSPEQPESWHKNPIEWLTTRDILKVMQQYEQAYKCFNFLGPSPIDFDSIHQDGKCVWEELCNFSLQDHIKRGKNKIGIIFNLDPHYKEGSHWISLFINAKKKYIFFMDSNGDKEPVQVSKLIKRIVSQAKQLGLDLTVLKNAPLVHQKKNTECGMYCLYTIISLLTDKRSPEFFSTHRVPDEDMVDLRDKYFNAHL